MRRVLAVLTIALLTSGCGGTSRGGPAASVASTAPPLTSPTPTPSPKTLTVAQAGTQYLQIVAPYNTALQKFQDAAHANKPWRDLLPLAGEVVRANAVQAQALRQTKWPVEIAAPMATLLTEIDLAQGDWQRAADAKTSDELAQAVRAAAAHSGSQPAGQIRTALGLPPYSKT